jgi:hypothetical protein
MEVSQPFSIMTGAIYNGQCECVMLLPFSALEAVSNHLEIHSIDHNRGIIEERQEGTRWAVPPLNYKLGRSLHLPIVVCQ